MVARLCAYFLIASSTAASARARLLASPSFPSSFSIIATFGAVVRRDRVRAIPVYVLLSAFAEAFFAASFLAFAAAFAAAFSAAFAAAASSISFFDTYLKYSSLYAFRRIVSINLMSSITPFCSHLFKFKSPPTNI